MLKVARPAAIASPAAVLTLLCQASLIRAQVLTALSISTAAQAAINTCPTHLLLKPKIMTKMNLLKFHLLMV